jgi:hypothetical protein
MDLVEHGVSVSKAQMSKLRKGGAINVKRSMIVPAEEAAYRVRIGRGKSKKMMTALGKGKGYRLAVMPNEDLVGVMEGGKIGSIKGTVFDRKFKSPSELRDTFGVTAIGKAGKAGAKGVVDTAGVVKRGFNREIRDSGVGKEIAKDLIDIGANYVLPAAGGVLGEFLGGPMGGVAGATMAGVAGKYIDEAAARKGYGLYKKLNKVGISKKDVKSAGKVLVKQAAKVGGEAITAYTGNPAAGAAFERVAGKAGTKAIDSSSVKKTMKSLGSEGKMLAVELIDDYVDENLSGAEKRAVENALAGKYPSARDLIYDYGNSKLEELNPPLEELNPPMSRQSNIFSGYGIVPRRTGCGMRSMIRGKSRMNDDMIYGGMMCGGMIGRAMVLPPQSPTTNIQLGGPRIQQNSAANYASSSPFIAMSPLLAKPITVGGSFRPAGGMYGGSFNPA